MGIREAEEEILLTEESQHLFKHPGEHFLLISTGSQAPCREGWCACRLGSNCRTLSLHRVSGQALSLNVADVLLTVKENQDCTSRELQQ